LNKAAFGIRPNSATPFSANGTAAASRKLRIAGTILENGAKHLIGWFENCSAFRPFLTGTGTNNCELATPIAAGFVVFLFFRMDNAKTYFPEKRAAIPVVSLRKRHEVVVSFTE
jgi:hypothetical protein